MDGFSWSIQPNDILSLSQLDGQVRQRKKITRDRYTRLIHRYQVPWSPRVISRSRSFVIIVRSHPGDQVVSFNVAFVHERFNTRDYARCIDTLRACRIAETLAANRARTGEELSRDGENGKRRRVMGGSRSSREGGNSVTSSLGLAAADRPFRS